MPRKKIRPKYLRRSVFEDMRLRGETRACYCCGATKPIGDFVRVASGGKGLILLASCEVCRRTGAYRDGGKHKMGGEFKLDRSTRKFVKINVIEGADFKDLWRGKAATADYAPFGWQDAVGV